MKALFMTMPRLGSGDPVKSVLLLGMDFLVYLNWMFVFFYKYVKTTFIKFCSAIVICFWVNGLLIVIRISDDLPGAMLYSHWRDLVLWKGTPVSFHISCGFSTMAINKWDHWILSILILSAMPASHIASQSRPLAVSGVGGGQQLRKDRMTLSEIRRH